MKLAYASQSSVNDIQLITRVVAGDAAAERELYETYVDRIYRLAFRLAGDDELARDLRRQPSFGHLRGSGAFAVVGVLARSGSW